MTAIKKLILEYKIFLKYQKCCNKEHSGYLKLDLASCGNRGSEVSVFDYFLFSIQKSCVIE